MTTDTAPWLGVYQPRPGAPLVLPGATLAEALAALPTPPPPRPRLTFAQAEALALVADGLTYRQIARRLFVSEVAIRRRMVRAFRRLGVRNRAAAIRAGVEAGLLDPARSPS